MGLVAAVELFVSMDESELYAEWDRRIATMAAGVTAAGSAAADVVVSTSEHFDRRQLHLDFGPAETDEGRAELRSTRVLASLAAGVPSIVGGRGEKGRDAVRLDPHTLQPGEAEVVATRLTDALREVL